MLKCVLLAAMASLVMLPVSIAAASPSTRNKPQIDFQPGELQVGRDRTMPVERGILEVPENRSDPDSRMIQLSVVLIRTKSEAPKPPVTFLPGGPGGSAIRGSGQVQAILVALNENRDVVLMDQRGVNESKPNVTYALEDEFPADFFLSKARTDEYMREADRKAIESFRKRGIDLNGYNTTESADDLNDLRVALGAEKMSAIGFSYGTHLGFELVRRHGEHIDAMALVGTEGPDHTLKLPSTYDRQLETLSKLAAENPEVAAKVPDMAATFARCLEKLEREPVTLEVRDWGSGETRKIQVGKFGLQLFVRIDIGDGNDFPSFPKMFHQIENGEYAMLQRHAEKRYNMFKRGISGMSRMVDGFSWASKERLARIRSEMPTCLLGDVVNWPTYDSWEVWGSPDAGEAYRKPIASKVRTLFVSGTLDSNTPPQQADEVRKKFSNSTHLAVEYAGHEDMLPNETVQMAIIDFINGKDVSDVRVSLGKPKFEVP